MQFSLCARKVQTIHLRKTREDVKRPANPSAKS